MANPYDLSRTRAYGDQSRTLLQTNPVEQRPLPSAPAPSNTSSALGDIRQTIPKAFRSPLEPSHIAPGINSGRVQPTENAIAICKLQIDQLKEQNIELLNDIKSHKAENTRLTGEQTKLHDDIRKSQSRISALLIGKSRKDDKAPVGLVQKANLNDRKAVAAVAIRAAQQGAPSNPLVTSPQIHHLPTEWSRAPSKPMEEVAVLDDQAEKKKLTAEMKSHLAEINVWAQKNGLLYEENSRLWSQLTQERERYAQLLEESTPQNSQPLQNTPLAYSSSTSDAQRHVHEDTVPKIAALPPGIGDKTGAEAEKINAPLATRPGGAHKFAVPSWTLHSVEDIQSLRGYFSQLSDAATNSYFETSTHENCYMIRQKKEGGAFYLTWLTGGDGEKKQIMNRMIARLEGSTVIDNGAWAAINEMEQAKRLPYDGGFRLK